VNISGPINFAYAAYAGMARPLSPLALVLWQLQFEQTGERPLCITHALRRALLNFGGGDGFVQQAFASRCSPFCPQTARRLPTWPRYAAENRVVMELNIESHVLTDPDGPVREIWKGVIF